MRAIVLLLALLSFAFPAAAQELQPGTRVRITAPTQRGDSRFVGTVMSTEDGRIRLRLDPAARQAARLDTISIPRDQVRQVEVSLGRTSTGGRSGAARVGALAGIAAGVGLGMALGSGRDGVKHPWTALWLAPTLGAVGAGTGALAGRGEHEQWRVVQPTRVAGLPLGRSVTLSIRLAF